MPDDYALFQAAKYLGVAPWDLAERPNYWQDRALVFAEAEALARADVQRRAGRAGGGRGR